MIQFKRAGWVSQAQPHRCQFSGFSNMRNALQSRRDYMFIAPNVLNLFRSVGAICQTKTLSKYRTYGAKETIIRLSINI